MSGEPPLWQLTLDYLRRHPSTSHPTGVDRSRVEDLLVELYILGERPTVDEVRAYLDKQGLGTSTWADGIVELWRKRLARPTRRHRGARGWAYPFVVPESLASKHGLRPVRPRLVGALAAAAADYLDRAERDPSSPETRAAKKLYVVTAGAVLFWAVARDRADNSSWPSVIVTKRTWYDEVAEHQTAAGRARTEARIAESLRRRDEQEQRLRELGLLDQGT